MRIIISSATIDAEAFKKFFEVGGAEKKNGDDNKESVGIISLEGRTFPVDVMYLEEPTEDYLEMAIKTVMDIHTKVYRFVYCANFRNLKVMSCFS